MTLPYIHTDSPAPPATLAAVAALIAAAMPLLSASVCRRRRFGIEGVWAFENGQIAITPTSDGTFVGTVVDETKFAECVHPVGEEIWTDMRLQPDGSYWGASPVVLRRNVRENPTLGPTAWRVREAPDGSRYLQVCFSAPGSSQPTIAANGLTANVTYNCVNSALTAPLPSSAAEWRASACRCRAPSGA